MTREQYEILLPYEKHLMTAKKCDYARSVTSDGFAAFNKVYKEIFHKDSGFGSGCGRCQLTSLKALADEFYKFQEAVEKELEPEKKDAENQPVVKNGRKSSANKKK